MGRPQKQKAAYFPHYTERGKTMFILESQWGNDGYALWYKLMEQLCESPGHFYDYSNDESRIYMSAYCKVPESKIEEIMTALVKLGEIDRELWEKGRIIWCQSLVDSLEPLYKKRSGTVPSKPVLDAETMISGTETAVSEPETPKKKAKKQKPAKTQYAEFVSMTEDEHRKLVEKYGEQRTARMIEVLDNYKGSSGKKYADDYRTILNWVVKRVLEEEGHNGGNIYGTSGNNGFTPSGGFRNS